MDGFSGLTGIDAPSDVRRDESRSMRGPRAVVSMCVEQSL